MKKNKKYMKGFTLVELIIVITILAILATIGFVSFQNYIKDTRDVNRVTTLNTIEKGLDLFQLQTGSYPNPDGEMYSGSINNKTLSYVGIIGKNISKIIRMNTIPLDPISSHNYVYGISENKQYYQLATSLENAEAYHFITPLTYANNGYYAKVIGNYKGILISGTGIYNLPSLIFTGSGNLLSNETYFVVDTEVNLPYRVSLNISTQNKNTSDIIKSITNNKAQNIVVVNKPNTMEEFNTNATQIATLGYDVDVIGPMVLGDKYEKSQVNISLPCLFGDGTTSGSEIGDCTL